MDEDEITDYGGSVQLDDGTEVAFVPLTHGSIELNVDSKQGALAVPVAPDKADELYRILGILLGY